MKHWLANHRRFAMTLFAIIGFASVNAALVPQLFDDRPQASLSATESSGESGWNPIQFRPSSEVTAERVELNRNAGFDVSVSNSGNEVVHIRSIVTGCGCVKADLDSRDIAPGEVVSLVGLIRGRNQPGTFNARISLNYTGADFRRSGQAQCLVTAVVNAACLTNPQRITLSPDRFAQLPGDQWVSVENVSHEPVTLDSLIAATDIDGLQVNPPSMELGPGESASFKVTVPADSTNWTGFLTFRQDGGHPLLRIPMDIQPRKPIRVDPPRLVLGLIDKSDSTVTSTLPAEVRLSGSAVVGSEIQLLKVPWPLSHAQVSEGEEDILISFRLSGEWNESRIDDTIAIELAPPAHGEPIRVQVPVLGIPRPRSR